MNDTNSAEYQARELRERAEVLSTWLAERVDTLDKADNLIVWTNPWRAHVQITIHEKHLLEFLALPGEDAEWIQTLTEHKKNYEFSVDGMQVDLCISRIGMSTQPVIRPVTARQLKEVHGGEGSTSTV